MTSALSSVSNHVAITLGRSGFKNRYFYNIIVTRQKKRKWEGDVIEQIGSFDPLPNDDNEKLVGINFLRLKYWLSREDVVISNSVLKLLGLCGYLPIHPLTYIDARHMRVELEKLNKKLDEAKKELVKRKEATKEQQQLLVEENEENEQKPAQAQQT